MITCKFNGRLGNNLFQIASLISISNEIGVDFVLPHTTWAGHRGVRDVDLSMFNYNFIRRDIETTHNYSEANFNYEKIEPKDDLCISGF